MLKVYKKIVPYFAALFIVYLVANIVWSQNLSNIFFRISDIKSSRNEMRQGAYEFLISIKKLPFFKTYLYRYKNVFGYDLENIIKIENEKRLSYLENLNNLLERNPKSRDVLHRLYLYYKESGDNNKANLYLKSIEQIDPTFIP